MEIKRNYTKSDKKFKCFNETFPHCAFALAISMIYPNRENIQTRFKVIFSVIAINGVMLYWFLLYLWKCICNHDMYNVSRNLTIGILVTLFFFKSFYVTNKTHRFAQLLEKISNDLLKGNDMDDRYQEIYEKYIKLGKLGQTCWIFIPILLTSQFPIYAGVSTIYESLKTDMGQKYMIHEMDLKYLEDKQYDSPIYELTFAYHLITCLTLSPNFAGFDGSFCIATNHLRLKLKLLAHKVERAFKDAKNKFELHTMIKETIRDHQEALSFYEDLQEVYGSWLFTVFAVTSLLISLNIYQIYLSERVDPKYAIFAISGIIHMFAPCYFASNLMKTSEELSLDLYSVEWEVWAYPAVTKQLIFMIAKSQQTLILTGNGIVYFNMQLFISVLQTSYSVFTLISS